MNQGSKTLRVVVPSSLARAAEDSQFLSSSQAESQSEAQSEEPRTERSESEGERSLSKGFSPEDLLSHLDDPFPAHRPVRVSSLAALRGKVRS